MIEKYLRRQFKTREKAQYELRNFALEKLAKSGTNVLIFSDTPFSAYGFISSIHSDLHIPIMKDDSGKEMNEDLRVHNSTWCVTKTSLWFENDSRVRARWNWMFRGLHIDYVLIDEGNEKYIPNEDYISMIAPSIVKKKGKIISFSLEGVPLRPREQILLNTDTA